MVSATAGGYTCGKTRCVAEDAKRHALRATFDRGAKGYEDARPVAAPEVFDDLVELAHLSPGAHLLEIGCGTGQATLPLAERGFSVLAVELGANLAELAREKLSAFAGVEVVISSFEDWDPQDRRFDAVVSFNAFHWIDPDVRFAKSASVLRPEGSLCVFGSGFVVHDQADPTWLQVLEDEAVTAGFEPRHIDSVQDRSEEFTRGGHFSTATRRTYVREVDYDADDYVALVGTMSAHRALDDDVRDELFERMRQQIEEGGGSVAPTRFDVLYVARKA
jgi:cyclopropane fatty-acyl-phospholipid synthase-like methyltransferase